MTIVFYLDEDAMSHSLVTGLRTRGVDVVTSSDAGMVGFPDEQHLQYAATQGRALYSYNVSDYYQLHTRFMEQGLSHAGIVLLQQGRYSVGEQMRRLLKLIATQYAEEMRDQIEFLSAWG